MIFFYGSEGLLGSGFAGVVSFIGPCGVRLASVLNSVSGEIKFWDGRVRVTVEISLSFTSYSYLLSAFFLFISESV
jgi:hypothetical protein